MKTKARDIMTPEVLTILDGTSVEDALKVLINHRITGLPVVNDRNEMVGVLSEYDIMLQVAQIKGKKSIYKEKVKYSSKAVTVDEETDLEEFLSLFLESKFRRLPVVNKDKQLVGVITRRDLMKLFYYRALLG